MQIARQAVPGRPEVRDYGLLGSALARPQATVFGKDAYPSLHGKAAALLQSLVSNHGLVDGNKRLGWLATATFLWINGYDVVATDDEIFRLVVGIAARDAPLDDVDHIRQELVRSTQLRPSS
ncbi:type II toxin-antitoxin system death-on-curing family toxin [Pseudonocardia alaniniphila]|uniref:Type II toxin-antitoxin system death-on-curing family toxin n=2 Tax=Pseudonocardia alaniniphila TaxID=75291 RepID=A0ABS9THS8_9PSEU|nr:type II toxin-antitoxin system death-on-curing family toxin [Pseudonocardia alaniniphila]